MNKDLLKDKRVIVAAGILVLLLIFGGVFYLLSSKSLNSTQTGQTNVLPTQAPLLKLSPSDIGLTLTLAPSMQYATMEVAKTSDIASIDYQFTYNALANGPGAQPGQTVERGTTGHLDVKTSGQALSQKLVFGTCSDVCHYDTGISNIDLIVKVTKNDGKIYQVELTVSPSPTP